MKRIFSSPHNAEVELLKNILADAGIVCEVRNGDISRIVPAPPFYEELWVSEEDYPKAADLAASWERPAVSPASGAWTCPSCGELIDGQFSSCWKCGALREKAPQDLT
jgi:hypothetical protein